MGWKIPEIKIRVPEVRVPRAPRAMTKPARVPKAPRATRAGSRLLDFDLTVFSADRKPRNTNYTPIIKALIETGGSRTKTAKKLGTPPSNVSRYVKNIRQMSGDQLQVYADQLEVSVEQIRTVCADLNSTKNISHIELISALLETGGSRAAASVKLSVTSSDVTARAKSILQLPDAELREYASRLGTTVAQIRTVCADLTKRKKSTYADVIEALLICGGARKKTAKRLGVTQSAVTAYANKLRRLSDAGLQKYAVQFGTTVAQIRTVCANRDASKGVSRINLIKALLVCGGNRAEAARELGIDGSCISGRAKNIKDLPAADLQKYASELSVLLKEKITIRQIIEVVSPRRKNKINFERRKQVIAALIASDGNRAKAAASLGINSAAVCMHAKNIRSLPETQLKIYAGQLNITVAEIKLVCADMGIAKGVTCIDVIRELIAANGFRTAASAKLKIKNSAITYYADKIRRLPDDQLQAYAVRLNTTVERIKDVCAGIKHQKGLSHIDVIKALIATGGSRSQAAKKFGINGNALSVHAKNIRQLSDVQLQIYADQLGVTVEQIRKICADLSPKKDLNRVDVIRALIETGGNRKKAAKKLEVTDAAVCQQAKTIRGLPPAELQEYAKQLKTTVKKIKTVCANLTPQKNITHIDAIKALIAAKGNRKKAGLKLRISSGVLYDHIKNIKQLHDEQLRKYAEEIGITVEQIKNICASQLKQAKGKLFKK